MTTGRWGRRAVGDGETAGTGTGTGTRSNVETRRGGRRTDEERWRGTRGPARTRDVMGAGSACARADKRPASSRSAAIARCSSFGRRSAMTTATASAKGREGGRMRNGLL
eukprot:29215-Pelagococcus_subviridis.AAC.8